MHQPHLEDQLVQFFAAGRRKCLTEWTSEAQKRSPDRVTSRRKVGHLGCGLLFIPPKPGLTPQLLISKALLDAHRHLPLHTAQLELTVSFFWFLLHVPPLAGCEPLPSESSGPISWAHGYFWTFLPLLKWDAHPAPSPGKEEMAQPSLQGLSAPGRERISLCQLCATPGRVGVRS